jgi:hypothetical protein
VIAALLAPLLAVLALQAPADEGALVIRADSAELARESFRLAALPAAAGGGWTLAATARYAASRPIVVLDAIVSLGPDSAPTSLEYTVADPREPRRILGQLARGRFTIRTLGRKSEHAREFPAPAPVVVLDDSVFALYLPAAWHARPRPIAVTAIFPRAGRRELLTVQDLGTQPTTLNRDPAALRHISVSGGANREVHVWLWPDGRLAKVEVPSRGIAAERAPGP